MSQTDHTDDTDGSGGRRVPSQDEYESQTATTRWVDLEDGDGAFEVRELPPMRLLRDMERFGVKALMSGDSDDVNARELVEDGDLNGFIDHTVLPNVVQPNAYWGDVGDGDFDLTSLTPKDLMTVIKGMLAADDEELQNLDPDDRENSFLGE